MSPQNITFRNISAYVSVLLTGLYSGTLVFDEGMITDNCIWLGAYQGQVVSGRAAIAEAMEKKELVGQAQIGRIYTTMIPTGKKHCETISDFERTATLPDGKTSTAQIRVHASWVRDEYWRIALVTVQTLIEKEARPKLFALSSPLTPPEERKLMLREKGTDNTILLQPSLIEWAENDSHYSTIHIEGKAFTVGIELRDLRKACEDVLIPCHASYLVNPRMVTSIKRFSLTLSSGVTLPIPEKRYTAVKKQLMAYLDKKE